MRRSLPSCWRALPALEVAPAMEGRRRDGISTPPAAQTRPGHHGQVLSFQWKAWKVIGPWCGRRCYGKRTGEALVKAIPPQRRAYDPGGRLGLSRAKKLAADQLGVKSLSVLGKGSFCGNAMVDWAAVAKA
jgi:hypothetical protein